MGSFFSRQCIDYSQCENVSNCLPLWSATTVAVGKTFGKSFLVIPKDTNDPLASRSSHIALLIDVTGFTRYDVNPISKNTEPCELWGTLFFLERDPVSMRPKLAWLSFPSERGHFDPSGFNFVELGTLDLNRRQIYDLVENYSSSPIERASLCIRDVQFYLTTVLEQLVWDYQSEKQTDFLWHDWDDVVLLYQRILDWAQLNYQIETVDTSTFKISVEESRLWCAYRPLSVELQKLVHPNSSGAIQLIGNALQDLDAIIVNNSIFHSLSTR